MKTSGVLLYMTLSIILGFIAVVAYFIERLSDTEPSYTVPLVIAVLAVLALVRAIMVVRTNKK